MSHNLSPREVEVVRLISLGCSTSEAAQIMGVVKSTADSQRSTAMRKLGVHKESLLTRKAIEHRISHMQDTLRPEEKNKLGWRQDAVVLDHHGQ